MQTSAFEVYVLGLLAVLERLPVPIAIAFDCESTRVQGNRAYRRLTGSGSHFYIDGEPALAEDLPMFRAARHAADVADIALQLVRHDGVRYELIASAWPLRNAEGEIEGSIGVFVDITQSREAERRAQIATRAMYESEERYRLIAEAIPQFVWLDAPDGGAIYANKRWLDYTGLTSEENAGFGWESVVHPDDKQRLSYERVRTIETGETYEGECRYRGKDGKYRWFLFRTIPVLDERGVLVSWLGTATDIDKQKRAERQQTFLARASAALGSSLDLDDTLERIARLAVDELGTWCQIDMPDAAGVLRVALVAHNDSHKQSILEPLVDRAIYAADSAQGPPGVFRSGKPQLLPQISEDVVKSVIPDERDREIYRRAGYTGGLMVPLRSNDRTIGVLGVASDDPGRLYTEFDVATALELARRGAAALQNAQSYQREHRVATTLQQALLPATLPQSAAVTFDSAYASEAFARGEAVGGDWFDAFPLSETALAVSIGDVAGHGVDAAVTMSSVRQAIRAAAIGELSPVQVLERANAIIALESRTPMVTAFYGVYDRERNEFRYAIAGHPAPLLVDDEGNFTRLEVAGPPLGAAFDLSLMREGRASVPAPATLVLYTDGLIEFSRDLIGTIARLESEVAERFFLSEARPAQAIIDAVLDAPQRDDIAVLVMRVNERPGSDLNVTMPARGRAAPVLRERLRRFAASRGFDEERTFRILTATGEALANSVEHAYGEGDGPVSLRAREESDGTVVVEVRDRGLWREPGTGASLSVRGRGREIMESLVKRMEIERNASGTLVRLCF